MRMTPDKILEALSALGQEVVLDPESHPNGPTKGDIPNLLAYLAAWVDKLLAEELDPLDGSMAEFRLGYLDSAGTGEDFIKAIALRAMFTASIVNAEELLERESIAMFHTMLYDAAMNMRKDLVPMDDD